MQTVIANKPVSANPALGGAPVESAADMSGSKDFAALMPEKTDERGSSEDPAQSETPPSAGQAAAAFWSAMSFFGLKGVAGGQSAAPLPSDPSQVLAGGVATSIADIATLGPDVSTDVPPNSAVPNLGGAMPPPPGAHALTTVGHLHPPTGQAVAPSPAAEAESATPPSMPVATGSATVAQADLAAPLTDSRPKPQPASAAVVADAALALVGQRLWQGTLPPDKDPSRVTDGPSVVSTLAAGTDTATAPPLAPTAAAPPVAGVVARLAETMLLSLFAAQAEAAVLDLTEGGAGFSPAGTPPAVLGAAAVVGPAAAVPQLAAQLVHTLANHSEGTTEIALSPDELGHVRVTLQADPQNPDRLIVMLNFERAETLDLFRRHADQLAEALRDAGFAGSDIGFGQSGSGHSSDPRSDGRHADQPPSAHEPATSLAPDQPTLRLAASSTLDLRL